MQLLLCLLLADGTVHFETYAGRRVFKRLHRVKLEGLEAGAVVHYRSCGVNLASDDNPYDPVFADAYEGEWHNVRTLDRKNFTLKMFNPEGKLIFER